MEISANKLLIAGNILLGSIILSIIISFIVKLLSKKNKGQSPQDSSSYKGLVTPLRLFILFLGAKFAFPYIKGHFSDFGWKDVDTDLYFQVIFLILAAFLLSRFNKFLFTYFKKFASKTESKLDDQLVPIIRKTIGLFIWIIALIMLVQTLGYSITSLVTGLGIGGLAIALAAQDSLSKIFGSISIFLDKPFIIGDLIKSGDIEGVVEEIGLRSTRIRTFDKTLITIPNDKISNTSINNFSKRPMRRVKVDIGVTYSTPSAKIQTAIAGIKEILEKDDSIDNDFYAVNFTAFGNSALIISCLFFVLKVDYREYISALEKVNFDILELFEKEGISFAFPSQSIYLEKS